MIRPPSAGEDDQVDVQPARLLSKRGAELFGVRRMLQHQRALQVAAAVKARRQPEVVLRAARRDAEQIQHRFSIWRSRIHLQMSYFFKILARTV